MEADSLKWIGSSCGLHGPYVFYKAFKFYLEGKARILSLGDFFLVRCKPEEPICIAELQLLWEERTTKQLLSSSKLYFHPEDTPSGRTVNHGEDEVIGVSEKVTVRLEDLVKWTTGDFSEWTHGRRRKMPTRVGVPSLMPLKSAVLRELGTNGHGEPLRDVSGPKGTHTQLADFEQRSAHTHLGSRFRISFRDVIREKAQIGEDEEEEEKMKVLVLSYPQYCRFRCILARLRGSAEVTTVTDRVVQALGGIGHFHGNMCILYCRDTFQYPALVHNDSICDHFAPNLKGRPRKRKLSQRRDNPNSNQNQNQAPQTSIHPRPLAKSSPESRLPAKVRAGCRVVITRVKNGDIYKRVSVEGKREERRRGRQRPDRSQETKGMDGEDKKMEEQTFLVALNKYMRKRKTPIERIPYLGFKQINLWMMFHITQRLGGYEKVTIHRQWKHVYDELGGHPGSTSAATCTRRHYERLLLPYERYSKGQEEGHDAEPHPIKEEPISAAGSRDEGSPSKCADAGAAAMLSSQVSENVTKHSQKKPKRQRKTKMAEEESMGEEELQLTVKQEESLPDKTCSNKNPTPTNQILNGGISLPTNGKQSILPSSDVLVGLLTQKQPSISGHTQFQATIPENPSNSSHRSAERDEQTPNQRPQPEMIISTKGCDVIPYVSNTHCILSPLAKKKLLSQEVYTGPLRPQIDSTAPAMATCCKASTQSNHVMGSRTWSSPVKPSSPGMGSAPVPSRPSVIQHAQSFRQPSCSSENQRALALGASEINPAREAPGRGLVHPCLASSKIHSTVSHMELSDTESQWRMQRPWEEQLDHPSHTLASITNQSLKDMLTLTSHPSSSAELQNHYVYSKADHPPCQPQTAKRCCQPSHLGPQACVSADRESSQKRGMAISKLPQNVMDVIVYKRFPTAVTQVQRGWSKEPAAMHLGASNQPASFNSPGAPLPKGPSRDQICPTMQQESRIPIISCPGQQPHVGFQLPDRNEVSLAYTGPGSNGVPGKPGMHCSSIGPRTFKRSSEAARSGMPPSKTWAISALHPNRVATIGPLTGECQRHKGEPPEPARAVHLNSYTRYPSNTPHLGGLCPVLTFGTQREACEGPRGLGYSHCHPPPPHPIPLTLLKDQGGTMLPTVGTPPLVLQGPLVRSANSSSLCPPSHFTEDTQKLCKAAVPALYTFRPLNHVPSHSTTPQD